MSQADSYHYAELQGPGYEPGNPVVYAFHGTGADETQFLQLASQLLPEAIVIAPRGDVSEQGALRFFRRTGEGIYDMDDLAVRTGAMAGFIETHIARLSPSRVVGLGYSNGANILVSVMLAQPKLFTHAVLMHPLIPWQLEAGDYLGGVQMLVTAGGRDPLCPPEMTGNLIEGLETAGAAVKSVWHPGGHEVAQTELDAVSEFINTIRADLKDVGDLPVEREQDDTGKGRYLIRGPGDLVAEMSYRLSKSGTLIIDHMEVPDVFRGKNAGLRMLKTLIDDARKEGWKIVPVCPFAAKQFERHPEWSDLLSHHVRTGGET